MKHLETPELPHTLDEWHEHSAEEPPQEEHGGHVSPKALALVFVAMVAFILVSIVALTVFFEHTSAKVRQERVETVYEYETEFMPAFEQAKASIGEYRMISAEDRTVQIPWDVAARRVVESYGN